MQHLDDRALSYSRFDSQIHRVLLARVKSYPIGSNLHTPCRVRADSSKYSLARTPAISDAAEASPGCMHAYSIELFNLSIVSSRSAAKHPTARSTASSRSRRIRLRMFSCSARAGMSSCSSSAILATGSIAGDAGGIDRRAVPSLRSTSLLVSRRSSMALVVLVVQLLEVRIDDVIVGRALPARATG